MEERTNSEKRTYFIEKSNSFCAEKILSRISWGIYLFLIAMFFRQLILSIDYAESHPFLSIILCLIFFIFLWNSNSIFKTFLLFMDFLIHDIDGIKTVYENDKRYIDSKILIIDAYYRKLCAGNNNEQVNSLSISFTNIQKFITRGASTYYYIENKQVAARGKRKPYKKYRR